MSCCATARRAATPPPPPVRAQEVLLRLRGDRAVDAHGPVSRRTYRVTPHAPVVAVHHRDAPYLVGSGWFTREG